MKEFKTVKEQIDLLKSRNILFNDETKVEKILLNNNYYNIINGYKDLFLDSYNKDNYKLGTTFEEIYALYEFDRQLRNIFLEYILKIENSLRSLIAYYFSYEYGNDNYLKLENFETFENTNVTFEKKMQNIKFIQSLIGNINKNIAKNIDNKYINHYIVNYGFIPMWVLVNILSFGEICNFYRLMKQRERTKIAIEFNINENDLYSLLNILNKTRNLCAHARYNMGKNDLFAVIISLKLLLSKDDYNKFHSKLFSRIMSIQSKLHTIKLNDVLNSMKFPSNWHDIIKMS